MQQTALAGACPAIALTGLASYLHLAITGTRRIYLCLLRIPLRCADIWQYPTGQSMLSHSYFTVTMLHN